MILIDQIVRFLSNDIYLPKTCNANEHKCMLKQKEHCNCKVFCKFPKRDMYAIIKISKQ